MAQVKRPIIYDGELANISLTKGRISIVDVQDIELVCEYNWSYSVHGYAVARIDDKVKYMHRVILGLPSDVEVDHINRNKLDNTRANLRAADRYLNTRNVGCLNTTRYGPRTSEYRGVCWDKKRCVWRSNININKKQIFLGYYTSEIEAAKVYNNAVRRYFGGLAYINPVEDA